MVATHVDGTGCIVHTRFSVVTNSIRVHRSQEYIYIYILYNIQLWLYSSNTG